MRKEVRHVLAWFAGGGSAVGLYLLGWSTIPRHLNISSPVGALAMLSMIVLSLFSFVGITLAVAGKD